MELLFWVLLMIAGLIGVGYSIKWLIREVRASRRPQRRWSAGNDSGTYESPLGLVDNPDDEWVEWAIMDDLLDDH